MFFLKRSFTIVGRAFGNLGLSHESLGEYQKAIRYQEQHLSIAAQMNDRVAKTLAYSSLGMYNVSQLHCR